MTDELIKKNTLIIISGLFVFLIISMIVWNFYSKNVIKNDLVNISEIIYSKVSETSSEDEIREVVDSFTSNDEWLKIDVANSIGSIIISSSSDASGESDYVTNLTDKEKNLLNNTTSNDRVYTRDNMIYYITQINDDIIIRTSIELQYNRIIILITLLVIIIVALGVLFLSLFLTRRTTARISLAFSQISDSLEATKEGVYQDIPINNRYVEVEEALKRIQEVNKNIYLSMITISNEREKLQFIIDNMDQGLIIVDGFGKILEFNNYAQKVIQAPFENGSSYEDLNLEPKTLEQIGNAVKKGINSFFDVKKEVLGTIYFCTVNCYENQWEQISESNRLIIVKFSDVTERRLSEKRKGEFITNASHELKTPITSISGFSELLLATADNLPASSINYLNIIYNESTKMKKIIDQLSLISNIENKFEQFDLDEEVYIDEITNEILKIEELMIKRMNLTIKTNLTHSMIKSNKILIDNVIRNLVDNAIKYNKINGSIELEITEDENVVHFRITDTGIGIEEKYLSQIFDRFYRVDKSHNSRIEGNGIGLDLVRQICIIINAKIEVKSVINEGTTFTIDFNKGL